MRSDLPDDTALDFPRKWHRLLLYLYKYIQKTSSASLLPSTTMSDEQNNIFDNPTSSDPFGAAKASAKKAAEDLRAAASAKANEFRATAEQRASHLRDVAHDKADEFKDYADKAWSEARTQAKDYAAEAEKFAKEKPFQALLAAFGVGLIVGAILKR